MRWRGSHPTAMRGRGGESVPVAWVLTYPALTGAGCQRLAATKAKPWRQAPVTERARLAGRWSGRSAPRQGRSHGRELREQQPRALEHILPGGHGPAALLGERPQGGLGLEDQGQAQALEEGGIGE